MNEENARRLAQRQERDRLKVTVADVEAYRELHYPGSRARRNEFLAREGVELHDDRYIAKLSHERFHEWFGTVCDNTCPHPREPQRQSWWRAIVERIRRPKLPRAEVRR